MFENGQEVKPASGTLIAYFSDDVHSVTEVTSGRRYTMACWFSDKAEHSECCKLLTQFPLHCPGPLQRSTIPPRCFTMKAARIFVCLSCALWALISKRSWMGALDGR